VLQLDGHCRIRPLQVRAAHDDAVDLVGAPTGLGKCLGDGGQCHLGLQAQLVLSPQRQVRAQPIGIEDAGLLHHVTAVDARRLLDELGIGQRTGLQFAPLDLARVVRVPRVDRNGERRGELVVADRERRREEAGACDDDAVGHLSTLPGGSASIVG
jgi:hypothetical protein